ncbi:MAG TPA: hypothetical protein VK912_05430 [Longimicrobiales bacterium]|nr:hypothetical protein [Longimicrobiales bacterium]
MTATKRLATFGVLAATCVQIIACNEAAEPLATAEATSGTMSSALVRTISPSAQDAGVPAYVRINESPPHVFGDGVMVGFVFYRDPACIPADFNLLTFFDMPAVFACPVLVEGFSLWDGVPFTQAPVMTQLSGSNVPVWFAPSDEVAAAMADGSLEIGEIAALDGLLKGTADRFHEVLQPRPSAAKLVLGAEGQLEDGRDFTFQFTWVDNDVKAIRIRIR